MEFLRKFFAPAADPDTPSADVMESPFRCPRTETVDRIADILDEDRVALIRGTPASGKTTLSFLLLEHFRRQNAAAVLIKRWPSMDCKESYDIFLANCARSAGYPSVTQHNLHMYDIVYIIDEAQTSYCDTEFWIGLIKSQSGARWGPRICLLSARGSPTEGPEDDFRDTPKAYFGNQQRVSITVSKAQSSPQVSLFYSRSEFENVLERECQDPLCPLQLHPDAADYVFHLTNGQPGAVHGVIGMIKKAFRSEIKHERISEISKGHILDLLDDEAKSFHFLAQMPVQRSFVPLRGLKSHAADVLRRVLFNGNIPLNLDDEGIDICYKNGWVHAEPLDCETEDVVCVFPTRLHAKYVEHYLTRSSVPFPIQEYPSVDCLAKASLKEFSFKNLSSEVRLSTAAVTRPVEAAYQDEFYRALHTVLGFSTKVTSEWSGDGCGRIDFWLPDVGWGIELLRDGDRLNEHCQRFAVGGKYARWIEGGWIKDWVVLDCRTTYPAQPYGDRAVKLLRAVFADGFLSVEILDASNEVVVPRFALKA